MGISTEMLVHEDMTSCTVTTLHSNSYYTVLTGIVLVSTGSCRRIQNKIGQKLGLFTAIHGCLCCTKILIEFTVQARNVGHGP